MANDQLSHSVEPDRTGALMQLEPSEVMAKFRAGQITRRDVFKLLGALGLTSMVVGRWARARWPTTR